MPPSFLYLMIPLWNRVSRATGAETRPMKWGATTCVCIDSSQDIGL